MHTVCKPALVSLVQAVEFALRLDLHCPRCRGGLVVQQCVDWVQDGAPRIAWMPCAGEAFDEGLPARVAWVVKRPANSMAHLSEFGGGWMNSTGIDLTSPPRSSERSRWLGDKEMDDDQAVYCARRLPAGCGPPRIEKGPDVARGSKSLATECEQDVANDAVTPAVARTPTAAH